MSTILKLSKNKFILLAPKDREGVSTGDQGRVVPEFTISIPTQPTLQVAKTKGSENGQMANDTASDGPKNSRLSTKKAGKVKEAVSTFNKKSSTKKSSEPKVPKEKTFSLDSITSPLGDNVLPSATLLNLESSYYKFGNNYNGVRIRIKGRIRGAARARKFVASYGKLKTQTINSSGPSGSGIYIQPLKTKWGT